MTAQDWRDLARVYRAALAVRALPLADSKILLVQAEMCETIARERARAERRERS